MSRGPLYDEVQQSPPIDLDKPYDPDWVSGKTILITGAASGIGEAFFRKWALHGANVIIGDINEQKGEELVAEIRQSTKNDNHHFVHCNVADWQSQVEFFQTAVQLSPTGGIDAVVANAGIADPPFKFERPEGLDEKNPPKPNMKAFDIDMVGVLYTVHLGIFWLNKNPNSMKPNLHANTDISGRDRHILLIGSIASITPLPGQPLYGVAKHGVLGLFRALRATLFDQGIRINLICPYFVDTPLMITGGRLLLAGTKLTTVEDTTDAATRFIADTRIAGHAVVVGPKMHVHVNDHLQLAQNGTPGKDVAIWPLLAEDWKVAEAFNTRFIRLLILAERIRGWIGFWTDIGKAFIYAMGAGKEAKKMKK